MCTASRMWVKYRSVVIIPPERGVWNLTVGLTKQNRKN